MKSKTRKGEKKERKTVENETMTVTHVLQNATELRKNTKNRLKKRNFQPTESTSAVDESNKAC